MRRLLVIAMCCVSGALPHGARSQPSRDASVSTFERMPRSLEVRFALSALPPELRSKAAVYLLDPATGYVLERTGTNGQSCFVVRTEWKPGEYRDDLYYAVCYDAEGAEHQMRALFDVAAFRARGMSAEAVKRVIEKRFDDGTYGRPQRAGVSYMIAPVQRTYYAGGTFVTVTLAHIMYYAPNVHNADIGGAAPMGPFPFVMDDGPHGYFIQILGAAETAKIVAAEAELLRDLCAYKRELCLAKR